MLISVVSQTGLEQLYEPSRSTYLEQTLPTPPRAPSTTNKAKEQPLFLDDDNDIEAPAEPASSAAQAISVERSIAKASAPTESAKRTQNAIPSRSRGRSPISNSSSLSQMAPRPTGLFGMRSSALHSPDSTQNRNLPTTHFVSTPKKTLEYEEEDDEEENGFSQDEEVRLILDNEKPDPPAATKPTRRLLQTTLNDVIQRQPGGLTTPTLKPPDNPRPDATVAEPVKATSSRNRFRDRIAGFASQGAVVDLDELDSDIDNEGQTAETAAHVVQRHEAGPPIDFEHSLSDDVDKETSQRSEDEVELQATIDKSSAVKAKAKSPILNEGIDSDIIMGTQEDIIEPEEDVSGRVIDNNQYIRQDHDEDITYIADLEPVIAQDAAPSEFRSEILKASPQGEIVVRCDIKKIRSRAKRRSHLENVSVQKKRRLDETDMLPEAGIANTDAAQVDRVLSRVIKKEDFAKMDILGQYNLAFIIARRRKPEENGQAIDDIFIIGKSNLLAFIVLY